MKKNRVRRAGKTKIARAVGIIAIALLTTFAITAIAQQAAIQARIKPVRDALAPFLGSEHISAVMIDEIIKVVREGEDADLEPLMRRIALLGREKEEYAEDFALWWNERGRTEVGGKVLWDRASLREAWNTIQNQNEIELMALVAKSASSDYAPAKLMQLMFQIESSRNAMASGFGDVGALINETRQLADGGDPDAAVVMYLMTETSRMRALSGTFIDGMKYLQIAADANIIFAMNELAEEYMGMNDPESQKKATELFRRAAEGGYRDAMESYARRLTLGLGVEKDPDEARKWREKTMMGAGGEAYIRSRVSRVRADMRSLATGLESYFIDNNSYPAMTRDASISANSDLAAAYPDAFKGSSGFRRKLNRIDLLRTLTTPVSYITNYFQDPFADIVGRTFSYATPDLKSSSGRPVPGWIIWSAGPDGILELTGSLEEYNPSLGVPSAALINKTYDPTNGISSRGDIYRMKR